MQWVLAWVGQLPKSVGLNNMYTCACVYILKGFHEIVVCGRMDLGIHSLEKLRVSLKFEKCYPVMIRL